MTREEHARMILDTESEQISERYGIAIEESRVLVREIWRRGCIYCNFEGIINLEIYEDTETGEEAVYAICHECNLALRHKFTEYEQPMFNNLLGSGTRLIPKKYDQEEHKRMVLELIQKSYERKDQ